MKANCLTRQIAAVLGSALITASTAGCAEKQPTITAAPSPANATTTTVAPAAAPETKPAVPTAAAAAPAVVLAQWNDIKECTYEMRAQFFAGFKGVEARVDLQIAELKAKRATMKGITGTREWDFEMKGMEAARAYLKSMGVELGKASRETWDQEKDRVGLAWVSTQEAYSKVKSSTTS